MKTINECFAELIEKRGWHKNSKYDRKTAWKDKENFKNGDIPYERKKEYLESAGYRIVIPEKWEKFYIKKNKL